MSAADDRSRALQDIVSLAQRHGIAGSEIAAALAMLFGWAMAVPRFARMLISLRGRT